MIRILLPMQLRLLAGVADEVLLDVPAPVTPRAILDGLEERYPMLRGAIRDQTTGQRRPFLRFFACRQDICHRIAGYAFARGQSFAADCLCVVGAIAGG